MKSGSKWILSKIDIGINRKKCTIQKHEMNRNNNNKFRRCLSLRRDKMPCNCFLHQSTVFVYCVAPIQSQSYQLTEKRSHQWTLPPFFHLHCFSPRFGMHIEHMQIIFILYEIARKFSKPSKNYILFVIHKHWEQERDEDVSCFCFFYHCILQFCTAFKPLYYQLNCV